MDVLLGNMLLEICIFFKLISEAVRTDFSIFAKLVIIEQSLTKRSEVCAYLYSDKAESYQTFREGNKMLGLVQGLLSSVNNLVPT